MGFFQTVLSKCAPCLPNSNPQHEELPASPNRRAANQRTAPEETTAASSGHPTLSRRTSIERLIANLPPQRPTNLRKQKSTLNLQEGLQHPGLRRRSLSVEAQGAAPGSTLEQLSPAITAGIAKITQKAVTEFKSGLQNMPLFRGLTLTPQMEQDIAAGLQQGQMVAPLMFGFRQHTPGAGLLPQEKKTLQEYASMFRGLPIDMAPTIILADKHAEHNEVPAAVHQPYYKEVKAFAEELGLKTVYLSEIFDSIGHDEHSIAKAGGNLAFPPGKKPADAPENAIELTKEEWGSYTKAARHMTERIDTVNARVNSQSNTKKKAIYDEKAIGYAKFRAGEGEVLLPALTKFFGKPALPVHVADPEAARIGVKGLYISAKDMHGEITGNIPWKETESQFDTVRGITPEQRAEMNKQAAQKQFDDELKNLDKAINGLKQFASKLKRAGNTEAFNAAEAAKDAALAAKTEANQAKENPSVALGALKTAVADASAAAEEARKACSTKKA